MPVYARRPALSARWRRGSVSILRNRSPDMIEFWTNPMSRGQIAHWMLEALGQPYQIHWLDWGPAGNKSPDFLAVNPMGKVPTIRHNGKVVTEAAAICLYLADAFPQAGL